MAAVEILDNLPMSALEKRLKECLLEYGDRNGSVLSSEELTDYILWMLNTYGHTQGTLTQEMLPFFTPGNKMTSVAAELSSPSPAGKNLRRLSALLASQNDEGFIAPGKDISVGRMLRYYPAHWHTSTYFSVYYCFSGSCPVHFQDEVLSLRRGSVLIVAPDVLHATPCLADDAVLAFYMMRAGTFETVFWKQLGEDNLLTRFFRLALSSAQATSYVWFETEGDPDVRRLLLQAYREHQEGLLYGTQMVNSLMSLFFLILLRRYEGSARLPRTEYFFWKHQFSAILSYIQTHYQNIKLQDVADRFHYSSKQVGRIVRDYTGESFQDLIRSMKMKKAASLLLEGRLSAQDIAEQTGYATLGSFYRSFKDYYGMPPQEWLKKEARSSLP